MSKAPTKASARRAGDSEMVPREERWDVYLFRKKGERLGSVEAKDKEQTVEKAIEEFQIREADRLRLSVQRE